MPLIYKFSRPSYLPQTTVHMAPWRHILIIDSFIVSLHSTNGRQFAICLQLGLCKGLPVTCQNGGNSHLLALQLARMHWTCRDHQSIFIQANHMDADTSQSKVLFHTALTVATDQGRATVYTDESYDIISSGAKLKTGTNPHSTLIARGNCILDKGN